MEALHEFVEPGWPSVAFVLRHRVYIFADPSESDSPPALGILPGGTGTQRLPRLVGRARAHEIVLGCDDIDAETAERWGYVNRALAPEDVGPFVERLARRIASFPGYAIAEAKAAMAAAEPDPVPGLQREAHHFSKTLAEPETQRRMERFFEIGGQTRERELELGELVEDLRG